MDEYIKRQAVLDLISRKSYIFSEPPVSYEEDILLKLYHGYYRKVEKLPAADVVEVVRCEKCQKFDPDEIAAPNTGTCWHHEMIKRFDDFCSYGERRSE